ncbi:Coatomer beta subunit, partial [Parasponia andersonii]
EGSKQESRMAMGRGRARASPSSGSWLLLVLTVMLAVAKADLLDKSSLSFPIEEQVDDDDFDADGGFSSLDGMLQWAIGHSDPAIMKESAKHVSTDDLNKRQSELKELMNNLNMPSDVELMQIAINDLLNNSSNLSLQDRHRALQELLILVEPIHNAHDLNKLGGLAVVIQELNHPDPHTRTLAAWILGKSAQNNPSLQTQVLELGALSKLMKMVKSHVVEEANKGLYAVSALIRNNFDGQELFYAEAGALLLQDILSNATTDIRLQKKAVLLVGDLAEDADDDVIVVPLFSSRILLKSVVDLITASSDLDLQEKALLAIRSLLQLRTTEAQVLKELCGLDVVLERMRQQLQDLTAEEYQKDYAMDLESLRSEVEIILHQKLSQLR